MSPAGQDLDNDLVTIITPTRDRSHMLQALYSCICSQDWINLEWFVEDDSSAPSLFMESLDDSRVTYTHLQATKSIGEKRNSMLKRAKGRYIIHFDDDDFYAPQYAWSTLPSHLLPFPWLGL